MKIELLRKSDDGTVNIASVHHQKSLEVSEDGTTLLLNDLDATLDRQKWVITK
ncbi:hypothetical protein [Paenibacillus sp. Marseille-Q4541]|uniref:hypothetical protein n=1 Tax=Paenibacillus sp. Marseille-Q4541 TaxID=2831522 RepID=UPI001BA60E1B|nr:hypothetical protein [Paenibacillus sp. Marseille-Q4541]